MRHFAGTRVIWHFAEKRFHERDPLCIMGELITLGIK